MVAKHHPVRLLPTLGIAGVFLLALALPARLFADSFTAPASLSDTHVSVGHPVLAMVNFGGPFASITRVCFRFTFIGDLLDPGDHMTVEPVTVGNGPGFENGGSGPESARSICVIPPDINIPPFLDGMEQIELRMEAGSVTIGSMNVDIDGVIGTVALRRTTWGVLKTLYR